MEDEFETLKLKYVEQRQINAHLILDIQALKGNIQVRG